MTSRRWVVVQKLGRDKQYFASVEGRRYHVLERTTP